MPENIKTAEHEEAGEVRTRIRDDEVMRGGALAASLLLVATMHGRHISSDSLLSGLPLENGILNPALFSRAAERAGLSSKILQQPLNKINEILCPVILLLNENRACVVLSIKREEGLCKVIFPEEMENGTVDFTFDRLAEFYTGHVIYIKPVFGGDIEKEKTKKSDGHWFWQTLGAEKKVYRDVILASFLSNMFAFAMPLFVMNVYNRIIPNNAIESLWVMATGVFIMITADFVLHLSRGYLTDLAASKTNTRLSADMMEHVLSIKSEARPSSVGSMINSIQGFDSVRSFISSATIFAYVDLPFSILFIAVIALIAWPLALPIIIGAVIVLIEAVMVQKKMRELSDTTGAASSIKNTTMVEGLVAIEAVKTQNLESQIQDKWERTVAFLEKTNVKMRMLSSMVVTQTQWINITISLSTMIIGVYLIRANQINMGALIAANMLSSRAMMPISRVAGLLMQYYTTSRSLRALNDVMAKETERDNETTYISRPVLSGDIEFREVTFSYPEQEKPALDNVSFRIKAGEKVALVGAIGSGKTTILKLILDLYRPQHGSVYLDGTDLCQIDPAEVRRNMGAVPQDVMLLNGTLRSNLVMGNPYVTDRELLFAVQISGVDAIVKNSPKGFDMQVGERGSKLSSGQRQAVSIARAVLRNPSVLLLDEPTSAMDSANEERIRHNMKIYTHNKTLLLVTHRAALLDLVDRVIVLDNGTVVADGPKDKVLAALREGAVSRGGQHNA